VTIADRIPLVVDIDGTLIRSDLMFEAALQLVATQPWNAWKLVRWLVRGKASFKKNLADTVDPHISSMPLREETVAAIAAANAQGREVWLASASDHRWVEQIAARIDGVDGLMGSDGVTNLAGPNKAAALVEKLAAVARSRGAAAARTAARYGTNASVFTAAGVPSVVFGPGSIAQAHTADEWIDLAQVGTAAEILAAVIATA
jgi:acetylornithine deacetylase/succinyl-diaminopimelate desuccinylase-like protein